MATIHSRDEGVIKFGSPVKNAVIIHDKDLQEQKNIAFNSDIEELLKEFKIEHKQAESLFGNFLEMMTGKKKRPDFIPGSTQKLRATLDGKSTNIYITINSVLEEGKYYPFEVFFNCSNTKLSGWLVALAKILSYLFKMNKDLRIGPEGIIKQFLSIEGEGYYDSSSHIFMPSILAHIGYAILWNQERNEELISSSSDKYLPRQHMKSYKEFYAECPKCHMKTLLVTGGCKECTNCDYSGGCGG